MNAGPIALRMPVCLGRYERGDPECDGHPSPGATLDELLPCLFRDRCVAFRKLIHETGKRRRDFVVARELTRGPVQGRYLFAREPDFCAQLDERVIRYDIRNGRVISRSGRLATKRRARGRKGRKLGPPSRNHRRKLVRRGLRRFRELRKQLHREGLDHLLLIAEQLGCTVKSEEMGARPGELFIHDEYVSRKSVTLYYRLCNRSSKLTHRAVVRFKPRIDPGGKPGVELLVACPYDAFIRVAAKRDLERFGFDERSQKDSYKVRLRRANRESTVALGQIVKKLAAQGFFGFEP